MTDLWTSSSPSEWRRALASYDAVVARQSIARLPDLDRWYRKRLPALLWARTPPHVTRDELLRATEWKMARGVWRAANLARVRGIGAEQVTKTSGRALALIPDPRAPIAALAELDGVGPATASAVAAAAAPEHYPFFDELVAAQIPELEAVKWTLAYYARYADALRTRAGLLGGGWTPALAEQALWAHSGGKAGRPH